MHERIVSSLSFIRKQDCFKISKDLELCNEFRDAIEQWCQTNKIESFIKYLEPIES